LRKKPKKTRKNITIENQIDNTPLSLEKESRRERPSKNGKRFTIIRTTVPERGK